MSTAFVVAIRESRPYLKERGWHTTADLMWAAADEIERLDGRVRELESRRPLGRRAAEAR